MLIHLLPIPRCACRLLPIRISVHFDLGWFVFSYKYMLISIYFNSSVSYKNLFLPSMLIRLPIKINMFMDTDICWFRICSYRSMLIRPLSVRICFFWSMFFLQPPVFLHFSLIFILSWLIPPCGLCFHIYITSMSDCGSPQPLVYWCAPGVIKPADDSLPDRQTRSSKFTVQQQTVFLHPLYSFRDV